MDDAVRGHEGDGRVETGSLENVRRRRRAFHSALIELERALATAAGHSDVWHDTVVAALRDFERTLAIHIEETEAPGGFYDELLATAPRLSPAVKRLRSEHDELVAEVTELLAWCAKDDVDVDELRARALELLRLSVEHRQLGSDLLYAAYEVDVSAGD